MSTVDGSPEQRWRRTVDRRERPARLKVGRLLRDFGYAELDPVAGDAIELRLAGVGLGVEPSLRSAAPDAIITIFGRPAEGAAPEPAAVVPATPVAPVAAPPDDADPDAELADEEPDDDDAPDVDPGQLRFDPETLQILDAEAQRLVAELAAQLDDARAEAERLRKALKATKRAKQELESASRQQISEQTAALDEQRRRLAELGDTLWNTRRALAETRDEVRRAVGEIGEPGELGELEDAVELPPAEFAYAEHELAGDRSADDGEQPTELYEEAYDGDGDGDPGADDDDGQPVPDEAGEGADEGALPELADPGEHPASEHAASEQAAAEDQVDEPPPATAPARGGTPERGGSRAGLGALRGRRGRGRGKAARWHGACSICGRVPDDAERDDLDGAGWALEGEAGACPQCQELGWQLRPGGGAPFRPLSPRRPKP